jgi:prephenate dehydrogenase
MQTVAIVGVGLIGGSFALALRKAGFEGAVVGVSSQRTVDQALARGVIDRAATLEEAAAEADLVYLAQPILKILEILPKLDAVVRSESLVTDAGSTKAQIVALASKKLTRARFLGGHPMAGKESRGVEAAEAGLFRNRTYVLTPERAEDLEEGAAREFRQWLERIGARVLVLSPERHDEMVALASHLPQLASTALASALAGQPGQEELPQVAGPGLHDATRLALSPYEIWRDILATNAAHIEEALGAYIERLEAIRASLRSGDLDQEFTAGAEFAAALRQFGQK